MYIVVGHNKIIFVLSLAAKPKTVSSWLRIPKTVVSVSVRAYCFVCIDTFASKPSLHSPPATPSLHTVPAQLDRVNCFWCLVYLP